MTLLLNLSISVIIASQSSLFFLSSLILTPFLKILYRTLTFLLEIKKCHCYLFLVFSQMIDHSLILAVIPSDFSSPYYVYPEVFVYLRLQELFSVQLFALVSLSLLRSTKSCSRVSYSVGSAPPSPDNLFSLLFSAENFY